jgi:septum formation protein
MVDAQFILASGSSRRRELLDQLGLHYAVVRADVEENVFAGEAPANYVNRIASEKARRVAATATSGLPVLAADTAVVLGGMILGKPEHSAGAREMLSRLSGHTHEVLTAVVLLTGDGVEHRRLSVSQVTFAPLEADWITAYCGSLEPLDKAGAYAIQGFAAQWISRLEGSYSGVMGLPLYETMELLRQAGIHAVPPLNVN